MVAFALKCFINGSQLTPDMEKVLPTTPKIMTKGYLVRL